MATLDDTMKSLPTSHTNICIDDVGMLAPTVEEAFFQTCKWMDICGRHGITQNPEKFHFAKDTVEFAGFEITTTNIRPSDTFIRTIKDFPMPRNITDVRSLFGLITRSVTVNPRLTNCAHFVNSCHRPLLSTGTIRWTPPLHTSIARSSRLSLMG